MYCTHPSLSCPCVVVKLLFTGGDDGSVCLRLAGALGEIVGQVAIFPEGMTGAAVRSLSSPVGSLKGERGRFFRDTIRVYIYPLLVPATAELSNESRGVRPVAKLSSWFGTGHFNFVPQPGSKCTIPAPVVLMHPSRQRRRCRGPRHRKDVKRPITPSHFEGIIPRTVCINTSNPVRNGSSRYRS